MGKSPTPHHFFVADLATDFVLCLIFQLVAIHSTSTNFGLACVRKGIYRLPGKKHGMSGIPHIFNFQSLPLNCWSCQDSDRPMAAAPWTHSGKGSGAFRRCRNLQVWVMISHSNLKIMKHTWKFAWLVGWLVGWFENKVSFFHCVLW